MNKKFSKILLIIELLVTGYWLLVTGYSASAAGVKFTPQITIPGFAEKGVPIEITGETFGLFMAALYKWATGAIAIICIGMIVYAGFRWMMAAGSSSQIGKAREIMINALVGLILVIGAYWLLNLLNPSLVKFKSLSLTEKEKTVKCLDNSLPVSCSLCADTGECRSLDGRPYKCDGKNVICCESKLNGTTQHCEVVGTPVFNICSPKVSSCNHCQAIQPSWQNCQYSNDPTQCPDGRAPCCISVSTLPGEVGKVYGNCLP